MIRAPMTDPAQALAFIFAGNARVTLVSKRTKKRYTYRVRVCHDKPSVWFAGLLTDSDNDSGYTYIGHCNGTGQFVPKRGCAMQPALQALNWAVVHLRYKNKIPADLEIWHEGRCGKCARTLTVPESIASGFGPECAKQRKAA